MSLEDVFMELTGRGLEDEAPEKEPALAGSHACVQRGALRQIEQNAREHLVLVGQRDAADQIRSILALRAVSS